MASYGASCVDSTSPLLRCARADPRSLAVLVVVVRSLPDSVPLVHQRAQTHLALLPSFSTFLRDLTQLERDFSAKASAHIGSFRLAISRSAQDRGGDSASLERALGGVLEQCDLQAREVGECAERVQREVSARLDEVGRRMGDVGKKVRLLLSLLDL